MASAGLLALLDDIATLLDDVALLTKLSAKKTAGVLGDDLALNAQQVSDVRAERELPIVWAVARGSMRNKAILVPAALLLSAFLPWIITPLLILGGAFLCFEGFEKIAGALWHRDAAREHADRLKSGLAEPSFDLLALEREKIKGAVRTDFILSAEIVVISLGIVQAAPMIQQIAVVSIIAVTMTVGVYGIVAAIVKFDDLGLYLVRRRGNGPAHRLAQHLGGGILRVCPYLMKTLSIAGTAAMFLVGGGILLHSAAAGFHPLDHLPLPAWLPTALVSALLNSAVGLAAGAVVAAAVAAIKWCFSRRPHTD